MTESDLKNDVGTCEYCPMNTRYIASWGDDESDTAIVGTQPGDQHPEESEVVFGLDLDRTAWSGEVIEDVFDELPYEKSEFYWTNAIKCVGVDEHSCDELLYRELSTFSKIILLGNDTVDAAPDFPGAAVHKLWHPAYVHRNRHKLSMYVRKWKDVLSTESPSTLSDFM